MEEEPAGYLGGTVGDDPYADDGYADPYAEPGDGYAADPYEGEEEVVGLLGGQTGEEELPALPGSAGEETYSHRDFIEGGEEGYADPYADPYAQGEGYEDPYALPGGSEYDDYEGYDEAAAGEEDASYFDSMGHDEGYTAPATQTVEPETHYDDAAPKTISQQDAESIIRRITTKRILPPEQEKPQIAPRQLTPSGGGLRIWPILVAFLLLGAGAVFVFREDIAKEFPDLAPLLGVELEKPKAIEEVPVEKPEVRLKREMLERVLLSELKAFNVTEKDLEVRKAAPTPPAGGPPPVEISQPTPDGSKGEEPGSSEGGE